MGDSEAIAVSGWSDKDYKYCIKQFPKFGKMVARCTTFLIRGESCQNIYTNKITKKPEWQ